tara:strand:+ start:283 stop:507 length:225 start_codon:yes stop_codon:yes gene_type:complete
MNLLTILYQENKSLSKISYYAVVLLAFVFVFGLFLVGYDQGHTFSLVYGEGAYVDQFLHELTHDIRHAAGFPCH